MVSVCQDEVNISLLVSLGYMVKSVGLGLRLHLTDSPTESIGNPSPRYRIKLVK